MLKQNLNNLCKEIGKLAEKLSNNNLFELISVLVYKMLFDFSYMFVMQKNTIDPYKLDFNIYKFVFGYLIVIIMNFANNKIKGTFSRTIMKIFFCLMFIPITTMYAGKNYQTTSYLLLTLEFIIIILTIIIMEKVFKENKNINLKTNRKKVFEIITKIIYYGFLANTIIVLFACFFYNGLPSLDALNFRNVYEVREEFYLPKILNYLYNFEIKFILIFLIILYLHKKNYIKFVLMIITLLLLYIYKGDKITLLSLPLAIFVYYIFKLSNKYSIDKFIPSAFALLVVISIITYNIFSMFFLVAIRRLMIVPANLKFLYLDFFSQNPKLGIFGTIFNAILKIPSEYDYITYPNLISSAYFGDYQVYSNTGFLAEGYARFGYVGIIIIPVILGFVISILNRNSGRFGIYFMMAISALPLMNLNDGFLLPSLTFGGILLLIIVSIFFDINYVGKNNKKDKVKQINSDTEANKEEK